MATYKGILTNNGKALIASATVNNKINYSHIAVGDGNGSVPDPSETRTALVNEKARIALNVVEINPNNTNQIMCEAIIPSNIGGFYIRELGLFAGPTMVVNANYPPTLKPLPDDGGAREINIKMVINIQNAEVIALYLDDSLIYATREWVNTNYIRRNEIVDNLITNDSNKPLSAKQGKALQDNKLEISRNLSDLKSSEVARKNLSLDKFTQNPNQNTAVGAPNVDAAIIITNTGWGVYKNSSATNFDPALPINYGGTGSTTVLGAKYNLRLDKFVQDPSVTSIYAPTTDSRIVITDKSWGIWSVDPAFNAALSAAYGGTGNTQGIAPSAAKLQTSRNIALSGAVSGSANFDGSGNINIGVSLQVGLGVNQWWQNVTASRAINTSYYNGTGNPIMVNVGFDDTDSINPTITIVVNGVVIIDQKYDGGTNFGTGQYCFVVPNASYYSVNNTTVNSHKIWSELR